MPSWWGKISSRDPKKKSNKESLLDALHRRLKIPSYENKANGSSKSRGQPADTVSEKGSQSQVHSRSTSPSKRVGRSQSFAERSIVITAQPLPLPGPRPAVVSRTDSLIREPVKRLAKSSLFRPPMCIRGKPDPEHDTAVASVSSESSLDIDDPIEPRHRNPAAADRRRAKGNSVPVSLRERPAAAVNGVLQRRHLRQHHVQVPPPPPHGAFSSAPDSSLSSPSKSPMRAFGTEKATHSTFWAGKTTATTAAAAHQDGSGQCSSPGSGYNSGHNSVGGDMSGQLFWHQTRGSPEYSPLPSPGPGSRTQSTSVTPLHPSDSHAFGVDDGKQQSHRLPLPPVNVSNASPFSHPNSSATSPSVPRSPARTDAAAAASCWKKGRLLGRGTFGHVYVGFNSASGEMCAMKEVTLFPDDSKSKESAKQLAQEIALLSRLRHRNIVQYYGSETVGDKLYIYLEYVSGGSIYKLLQDYGQFGELVIRSYTQQILLGLAYLHGKNTVHRDIKGANILVDPSGRIKLADFGMAKHIKGQSCPLSFKGSPYWMAPEVIKNSNGCNLAVDVWSLGCTVLEMATSKPPWSQYEGVAAMFKIGNSKELPGIPDCLSGDGRDFVRQCLQRNPQHRPSAAQLLDHPFVKDVAHVERPEIIIPSDAAAVSRLMTEQGDDAFRYEKLSVRSFRSPKGNLRSGDSHVQRYISCPVSPIGSPLLRSSRSPQHQSGRFTPSPISSPVTPSGAVPWSAPPLNRLHDPFRGIQVPVGSRVARPNPGPFHCVQ